MAEIPQAYRDLFTKPAFASLVTLMPDGSPQVTPVWCDLQDGMVVVNTAKGRLKDRNMRRDPRVALTALGVDSWYSHVSLIGRIVSIEDDPELRDIDRLARRYTGREFRSRDARRVSAWLEPDRWHAWS